MSSQSCDCTTSEADPKKLATASCRRCRSEPYIILDKVHVECLDCFIESCNKKLRSTIGRSRLLRNNDKVIIAHTGSSSDSTLMDLIKRSMLNDARRQQKFRPSIVYVDTNIWWEFNQRIVHLRERLSSIRELYPDWTLYWTTIESYYNVNLRFTTHLPCYEDLVEADRGGHLRNYFSQKDHTEVLKLKQDITISLVGLIANELNSKSPDDPYKFIFVGSTASELASNLLVNVISGEGSKTRSTVSVCDRRGLLPIIRPLREFSSKEIAFYIHARRIRHCDEISTHSNMQPLLASYSIQSATESFLAKLDKNYPGTYSTLLKIGDKMQELPDQAS